jgi:sec-independent protein translocase protein TatA
MGIGELLVVLFIVLLFFGASRLPALGQGLGKALRNMKGAVKTDASPARGAEPRRELPAPPKDGSGA